MIRFCLLVFFVGLMANAQKLELRIDAIEVDDTDAIERIYNVYYHLENLTDQRLLFFQDFDELIPSASGANTCIPYFKIFEDSQLIECNIFSGWKKMNVEFSSTVMKSVLNENQAAFLKKNPKSLLGKLQSLEPREKRLFSQSIYWNRERYYHTHDLEYYLDEKGSYFFEITMVMVKELHRKDLPEEFYKQITEDSGFLIGAFTSNKQLIDFGTKKGH